MAVVLAQRLGVTFEYVVANTIHGMIAAVNGDCDAFLWEVVTTKPYYDAGSVRMLDTLTSPWPAFCMASTQWVDEGKVRDFTNELAQKVQLFVRDFATVGSKYIMTDRSDVFHYKSIADLENWFAGTQFNPSLGEVSRAGLRGCIDCLVEAGLIDQARLVEWERMNGRAVEEAICHTTLVKLV